MQAAHSHIGFEACSVCASRTLRFAVVSVCLVLRRDGQFRLVDCQVAFNIRDIIVAGVFADSGCARDDLVGVGALVRLAAVQRDARKSVAALQAFHRHIGIKNCGVSAGRTLGRTVICVGPVVRRNRQVGLAYLQPAVRNAECHVVVRVRRAKLVLCQSHRIARICIHIRS